MGTQLSDQEDFHHNHKNELSDQEVSIDQNEQFTDQEVSIDQSEEELRDHQSAIQESKDHQLSDQVEFTTQTEESKDHQSATQDSAHHESSQSEDHAVPDQFDSADDQFDIVDQSDESDDQDVSEDDDQSDIVKLITGHERGRAIRRGKCSSLKLIDLISSVASSQLNSQMKFV